MSVPLLCFLTPARPVPSDPTTALQRQRMLREGGFRELRWSATRETLVNAACTMRDHSLLTAVFYAWATLRWRRKALLASAAGAAMVAARTATVPPPSDGVAGTPLVVLQTLEQQRLRLVQLLHEAHAENRWHRQLTSGVLRQKLLLLLWAGGSRTLQRCWLAWSAHMLRRRVARELKSEAHQLAFALRVAALSQAPNLTIADGAGSRGGEDRRAATAGSRTRGVDCASIFAGYNMRRAWAGWCAAVSLARIQAAYQQGVEDTLSAERAIEGQTPAGARASEGASKGDGFRWLGLFSARGDDSTRDSASRCGASASTTGQTLCRHLDVRRKSIALLGWRAVKTASKLRSMRERDQSALLVAVWNASVSGVMQSTDSGVVPRLARGLLTTRAEDSDSE